MTGYDIILLEQGLGDIMGLFVSRLHPLRLWFFFFFFPSSAPLMNSANRHVNSNFKSDQ